MKVDVRIPNQGVAELDDVLDALSAPSNVRPYSDEIIDACADIALALSKHGRTYPELQALSFWMRKAELRRLRAAYQDLLSDSVRLVPRGLVFHVPPANVDTIFIYSWLLSVLSGNRNIIRLSSRQTPITETILSVIEQVLGGEKHSWVRDSTVMVSYPRGSAHNDAISARSDVRVIWGGDQTIRAIRRSPLPPHATELAFPDRFSMAALKVSAYQQLDEAGRFELAEKFFNDSFWFDQMGCSSPRVVIWEGNDDDVAVASRLFYDHLSQIAKRKEYLVEGATAISKLTFSYGAAIDHDVDSYLKLGNEVTVLQLSEFSQVRGEFCGAGFFFQLRVDKLEGIVDRLERRDQTLATFGFSQDELVQFADAANGRGIDRIVPFGEALNFNRIWDGNDLLQAFSRRVWVQSSRAL